MAIEDNSSIFCSNPVYAFAYTDLSLPQIDALRISEQVHRSDHETTTCSASSSSSYCVEEAPFTNRLLDCALTAQRRSLYKYAQETRQGKTGAEGGEEGRRTKRKLQSSIAGDGSFEYVDCCSYYSSCKRRLFNLYVGVSLADEERICDCK
eukprot:3748852-Rhodomonas_salina.1